MRISAAYKSINAWAGRLGIVCHARGFNRAFSVFCNEDSGCSDAPAGCLDVPTGCFDAPAGSPLKDCGNDTVNKQTANRGFSLVEVLVAMTILTIGILGIATLTGTALKTSSYSQALTQAVNLAENRLEALRSVPFDNLELTDNLTARTDLLRACNGVAPTFNCVPTNTIDVQWSATDFTATGKMHFTWTYVVTYLDIDGNGVANPSADGAKRVDVTVAWTDLLWHVTKNVRLTTIITRR